MNATVTGPAAIADGAGDFVIDTIEARPAPAYWLRMIEASLRFFGTILIERR